MSGARVVSHWPAAGHPHQSGVWAWAHAGPLDRALAVETSRLRLPVIVGGHVAKSPPGFPGMWIEDGAGPDDLTDVLAKLAELGLICAFVRSCPLDPMPEKLLTGAGWWPHAVVDHGVTAGVRTADRTPDQLWEGLSGSIRKAVEKAEKAGYACWRDPRFSRLSEFLELHDKVFAGAVPLDEDAVDLMGHAGQLELFVVIAPDGSLAGGQLVVHSWRVAEVWAAVAAPEHRDASPIKMADARTLEWAAGAFEWVHLGGGLNGEEDGLLAYKLRLGAEKLPNWTLRVVLNEERFEAACGRRGIEPDLAGWFPPWERKEG